MRSSSKILYDTFAKDDSQSFEEFEEELMNEVDYQLMLDAINFARKEALQEAADKCGIGLPTFWAVQDEIKKLITQVK